ncbi:MAG: hypothetical protein ABH862_05140 [Candidatus Omnitrophota bacterium]
MKYNKPKARVDGREIPIEILGKDEKGARNPRPQTFSVWKAYVPFVVSGLILVGTIVLSITLFVWALPVLLPILLVIFIARMIKK